MDQLVDHTRTVSTTRPAARPLLVVWKAMARWARARRHRREVNQLLGWSDAALRDIGLTHGDVELALGLPSHEDPSMRLRFWALERRSVRLLNQREAEARAAKAQRRLAGCE